MRFRVDWKSPAEGLGVGGKCGAQVSPTLDIKSLLVAVSAFGLETKEGLDTDRNLAGRKARERREGQGSKSLAPPIFYWHYKYHSEMLR